jgi:hypothetical protein
MWRLLSTSAEITRSGDCLIVREPRRVRWLLLGAYWRRVAFDAVRRRITVESCIGWLHVARRKLDFAHVAAITYSHRDLNQPYTSDFVADAWDSYDHFAVGLRLTDGTDVSVADFVGEGTWTNDTGWPDWVFFPRRLFDWAGDQEQVSRQLVNELSELLNVPVIPGPRD